MRKGPIIFVVIVLAVLGLLIRSVYTLLTLLFEDFSRDAIPHADFLVPNSTAIYERPQLIPKIIHQTYANDSIPEHWKAPQQSCIDLHKDYEYKVRRWMALVAQKCRGVAGCSWNIDVDVCCYSSGRTTRPMLSSRPSIPPSWPPSRVTRIRSSARMPSATLCWPTTVACT